MSGLAMLGLGLIGSLLTLGAENLAMTQLRRAYDAAPRRQRRTTTHHPNGTRECARRRRQIEAGSLRVENGLCQAVSL